MAFSYLTIRDIPMSAEMTFWSKNIQTSRLHYCNDNINAFRGLECFLLCLFLHFKPQIATEIACRTRHFTNLLIHHWPRKHLLVLNILKLQGWIIHKTCFWSHFHCWRWDNCCARMPFSTLLGGLNNASGWSFNLFAIVPSRQPFQKLRRCPISTLYAD